MPLVSDSLLTPFPAILYKYLDSHYYAGRFEKVEGGATHMDFGLAILLFIRRFPC